MNNFIIVLYKSGFHGEFFIGNIVSNTDKFHYEYFKCRTEEFNAYRYEIIKSAESSKADIAVKLTNGQRLSQIELTNMSLGTDVSLSQIDDMMNYYSLCNKPVIFKSHNFNFLFTLPLVKLYTEDLMYIKRGVLIQCIKCYFIQYIKSRYIAGYKLDKGPPLNFITPLKEGNHTTDSILYVDIKEWLHNENLEKIEDFFQIKYTQAMKDAVIQYYERDNVLLDKYFPNWQNQSDEHLIEEMAQIDKKYAFTFADKFK